MADVETLQADPMFEQPRQHQMNEEHDELIDYTMQDGQENVSVLSSDNLALFTAPPTPPHCKQFPGSEQPPVTTNFSQMAPQQASNPAVSFNPVDELEGDETFPQDGSNGDYYVNDGDEYQDHVVEGGEGFENALNYEMSNEEGMGEGEGLGLGAGEEGERGEEPIIQLAGADDQEIEYPALSSEEGVFGDFAEEREGEELTEGREGETGGEDVVTGTIENDEGDYYQEQEQHEEVVVTDEVVIEQGEMGVESRGGVEENNQEFGYGSGASEIYDVADQSGQEFAGDQGEQEVFDYSSGEAGSQLAPADEHDDGFYEGGDSQEFSRNSGAEFSNPEGEVPVTTDEEVQQQQLPIELSKPLSQDDGMVGPEFTEEHEQEVEGGDNLSSSVGAVDEISTVIPSVDKAAEESDAPPTYGETEEAGEEEQQQEQGLAYEVKSQDEQHNGLGKEAVDAEMNDLNGEEVSEEGAVGSAGGSTPPACLLEFQNTLFCLFSRLENAIVAAANARPPILSGSEEKPAVAVGGDMDGVDAEVAMQPHLIFGQPEDGSQMLFEDKLTSFIAEIKWTFELSGTDVVTLEFPQLVLSIAETSIYAQKYSLSQLHELFKSYRQYQINHNEIEPSLNEPFKIIVHASKNTFQAQMNFLTDILREVDPDHEFLLRQDTESPENEYMDYDEMNEEYEMEEFGGDEADEEGLGLEEGDRIHPDEEQEVGQPTDSRQVDEDASGDIAGKENYVADDQFDVYDENVVDGEDVELVNVIAENEIPTEDIRGEKRKTPTPSGNGDDFDENEGENSKRLRQD
ncbi:hypothetical protein HDU76_007700 [Blyttiomyces sp. JEL0837]|nr:hypothetical protein HDU76_007700 [Blyttiomyces sp. JEL0837]